VRSFAVTFPVTQSKSIAFSQPFSFTVTKPLTLSKRKPIA
jgi:hypothetical protein